LASGTSVFQVSGDFSLKIEPGEPLAGRDVLFTLTGLEPWAEVKVDFVNPIGQAAQSVTDEDVLVVGAGGAPVTERFFFADGQGKAQWTRIGARDQEGAWSANITVDGETSSVSYTVSQLQLASSGNQTVGVEMRVYAGSASETFYSSLVPSTLAVDLQAHLAWVVGQLKDDWGVQSRQIPDIYLAGNDSLLRQVAQSTGTTIGFEDGYYRSAGIRPGIFMRTDFYATGVRSILTHEYTHLLLQESAQDKQLPAWLNEGISRDSEHRLNVMGARPSAGLLRVFQDADTAKAAAIAGASPNLTSLESQLAWNSQTNPEQVNLQYATSYMAARYLAETYGPLSPIDIIKRIGGGQPLTAAVLQITGIQYLDFRTRFVQWLQQWEDPDRAEVRPYVSTIQSIIDSVKDISRRRALDLDSSAHRSSRIPVKAGLVDEATELLAQLNALTPPSTQTDLHQSTLEYLGAVARWLTLELNYLETLTDSLLDEANGTIPEISAREYELGQDISTVKFVYNLD